MGGYSGNPADVAAYNSRLRQKESGATGIGLLGGNDFSIGGNRFGVGAGGSLVGPGGPAAAPQFDATDAVIQSRKFAQLMGQRYANGMKSTFVSGPTGSNATGAVSYGLPASGSAGKTLLGQ